MSSSRKNSRTARVVGLYTADAPNSFVSRPLAEAELEFGGIRGDRHFGLTAKADVRQPMYPRGTEILNRRQISLLSAEEMEAVRADMAVEALEPEWIGANLMLAGLPELTKLLPGTRLLFPSGAGLVCEGENHPCMQAGKEVQNHVAPRERLPQSFVKAAAGRRGILCSVERPGRVCHGDEIRILDPI
ncbi:MOSC domain-containing protein [Paenibacillus sp. D51F]